MSVKTISCQFEQDIDDYGDNACLMWEIRHVNSDVEYTWVTAYSNNMLESACTSIIRRKQSAELPFDLDRAKGGDVVQVLRSDGVWFDALDTDNTLPIKLFELGKEKELRMKYPPKKKISSILNQE